MKNSTAIQLSCIFYNNNHKPYKCQVIINISARKKVLSKKRRCFRCLFESHLSHQSPSSFKSFKCGRLHHISICDNDKLEAYAKSDNEKQNGNLVSVVRVFLLPTELLCYKLH